MRLLTAERLATYQRACEGRSEQALRLYAWNVSAAAAFWGGFNVMEVALRNAVHAALGDLAECEEWWQVPLPLHPFEQKRVAEGVLAAQKDQGGDLRPGHVVAELSLGFWTGLLANKYHQRLWVPAVYRAFPHLQGRRRELHRKLETLRKLRNRVAHHEPIFARNLAADHRRLLEVLGAMSPEAVAWVEARTRVPAILSARDSVLDGTVSPAF